MPRNYKLARKMKKITLTAAAKVLGVSQPTLSGWESGRTSPSPDALECMADLYGVTTDYLLGRVQEETVPKNKLKTVVPAALPSLHGEAVWSKEYGWALVNGIGKLLITVDRGTVPFLDAGPIYHLPPAFSVGYYNFQEPIALSEIKTRTKIWVEPISADSQIKSELRGWYAVRDRYVQNEYGNRFYLDAYGSKWLAFDSDLAG